MPRPTPLPTFTNAPFTRAQARAAGLSDSVLRSRRIRTLFAGVYVAATVVPTYRLWLTAALLASPPDAVISHASAMRLYGFSVAPQFPIHVSTNSATHSRRPGLITHQRRWHIGRVDLDSIPVTGPRRTLVDIAGRTNVVTLVQAIEFMLHAQRTTLPQIVDYIQDSHLDGVQRMRRIVPMARLGAESPMETWLRLLLVFARLPEPEINPNIFAPDGSFLARGDLVYRQLRVLVEYDGMHHERDQAQRLHDVTRREQLEAHGWRVVVITSADLPTPHAIAQRVFDALQARGYGGPSPVFSAMWSRWFTYRAPAAAA